MAADVGEDAVTPSLSKLDMALRERRFIVTAEVTSPVGANAASLRRRARLLRGLVIAANVPDGQAATTHLGPLAAARLLLDEGVEPVLTLQCRDRNRLALQSELSRCVCPLDGRVAHSRSSRAGGDPRDRRAAPVPARHEFSACTSRRQDSRERSTPFQRPFRRCLCEGKPAFVR